MRLNLVAAGLFVAMAAAASTVDPSAGVIVGMSGHVTVERTGAAPKSAVLGMRLEAVDVVVVDRGASADVYLKGGGVVRLREGTRFDMPKAADTPANGAAQSKLREGSIAQLESGLWVLNDPHGSLLVSPMRGDSGWDQAEAPVPLTPRYEALTATAAQFLWSGGPRRARVVVAKRRDVVWKSDPVAPGAFVTPGTALPLAAGEAYTWWLEPEAGGAPLTAGIPFRVAAIDVIERTKSVEAELRTVGGAADYLRIAHYAGAGSWTHVLDLASRMAPCEARNKALDAAAGGLRLDVKTAASLAEQLREGGQSERGQVSR